MPKKSKLYKPEHEHKKAFILLRNKHSAVESNINELEDRAMGRCPDKDYQHFKRYIALGICAHNLHKIGAKLIKDELEKQKKAHKKAA
jgi:IS5 family transposase